MRDGQNEYTAYVRQYGAANTNYLFNVDTNGVAAQYSYDATGAVTAIPTNFNISTYIQTLLQLCVTDYGHYICAGSVAPNSNVFEKLVVFAASGLVLLNQDFESIQAMTLDRASNLYLAIEGVTGSSVQIFKITEGENSFSIAETGLITKDFNDNDLANIQTICADLQIIVGTDVNTITIYDAVTLVPQTTYDDSAIQQLGEYSAILSNSDRFLISDTSANPNFYLGIPTGSNTMQNCITGIPFNAGSWLGTGRHAIGLNLGGTVYGYGAGNNNQTYGYTYDPTNGVSGTPFFVTSTPLINSCWSSGSQNLRNPWCTINGVVGAVGALAIDQGTLTPNWSTVDRNNFPVPGSNTSPVACDVYDPTEQLVSVGTDGNIYITSNAYLPKVYYNFYRGTEFEPQPLPGTTEYIAKVVQQGVGWNTNAPGLITAYTAKQQEQLIAAANIEQSVYGFVKIGDFGYTLLYQAFAEPNILPNLTIVKKQLPAFTTLTTFNINASMGNATARYGFCYLPLNNCFAVSNGSNTINLYSTADGTSQGTISLPGTTPTTGFGWSLSSINEGGDEYLMVITYNYWYVFKTTVLGSVATLYADNLGTADNIGISGSIFYNPLAAGFSAILTYGTTGDPANQCLGAAGYNFTQTGTPNWSVSQPTQLFPLETYYLVNSMQNVFVNTSINGIEVTLLQAGSGGPDTFGGNVLMYNIASQEIVSTASSVGVSNLFNPVITYFYPAPSIDYTYSYTAIQKLGSSFNTTCISFSRTNPNTIYATSTSGVVYRGVFKPSLNTITFSPYPFITNTFQSINLLPTPKLTYNSTIYNYGISGQTPHGSAAQGIGRISGIARNAVANQFLVSQEGTLGAINPVDCSTLWFNQTITGLNNIWVKNAEDLDVGAYDIYTFSELITAINNAFAEAFAKVPAGTFAEAPKLTFDYTSGLLTLSYSSDYTNPAAGTFIMMNDALLRLAYFDSSVDSINTNFNALVLPPGSTSLTQTSKSLFQFNQLDKILFISNTIYVFGSYFGANSTDNIITDVDIPTASAGYNENVGQVLYFQPQFLRPYILATNQPINRINLQVWYSYLNGQQFQLYLAPDDNWNAKLIFPRRY